MHWYQGNEEEEDIDLMYSPALLARRASESWIDCAPIEVVMIACVDILVFKILFHNEIICTDFILDSEGFC